MKIEKNKKDKMHKKIILLYAEWIKTYKFVDKIFKFV